MQSESESKFETMDEPCREDQLSLPRREFMRDAGLAAAAFMIVPRHVLGGAGYVAPSDRVNVAGIGVGGIGRANLAALSSQNLVAMCDVDWGYVDARYAQISAQIEEISKRLNQAETAEQRVGAQTQMTNLRTLQEKAPRAARYTDYREMLEKQKDIDAVVVGTPDHTHAVIALAAMNLGKHVYLQKPLAWSVEECRRLAQRAAETKVVTQMGNQGHSSDDARLVNEYIASGAIGRVEEVHVWTNRPLAYWPQGIPRPADSSAPPQELKWDMNGVMQRLGNALGSYAPPDKLAWELFLGPSPYVAYHPIYHPFNWRGWVDWGVGAIGDMGAHLIDHPFWALDLGYPTSVETHSTPYNRHSYPMSTITYYEFPRKRSRPAVRLTWYDGGLLPPKPEELEGEELDPGGGVLYVGSRGKLLHDTYGANPRLLPQSLQERTRKPRERYERIATSHEMNWIEAIQGKAQASSPFEYAAPLTEVMLLGIAALNAGKKIRYDAANMRITNVEDSDALLKRVYRAGWSLA
jgi:predicted dehydrogenase